MALQIIQNNGTFHLQGTLTKSTTRSFIIQFEHLVQNIKNVTINNDRVSKIDKSGVEAIKTLIAIALRNESEFSVVGKGSKDIYEDFLTPYSCLVNVEKNTTSLNH